MRCLSHNWIQKSQVYVCCVLEYWDNSSYPTAISPLLDVVRKGSSELEGVISEATISLGKFDFSQFDLIAALPVELEIDFEDPDSDEELGDDSDDEYQKERL